MTDEAGDLTEGSGRVRPRHGRHDDEAEALVLAPLDLHVVGLQGHHRAAAAAAAAAADAAGAAGARADGVQRVLAALRRPLLLRERRRLRAAVVGRGRRRGHVRLALVHYGQRITRPAYRVTKQAKTPDSDSGAF